MKMLKKKGNPSAEASAWPYRASSDEPCGCKVGIVHGKEEEGVRDTYFLPPIFSFPVIKVCSMGISTPHLKKKKKKKYWDLS